MCCSELFFHCRNYRGSSKLVFMHNKDKPAIHQDLLIYTELSLLPSRVEKEAFGVKGPVGLLRETMPATYADRQETHK